MVLLVQAATYEGPKRDILIDVGTADSFLENQLKPDDFTEAAAGNKALAVQLRKQARPTLRVFMPALCSCGFHTFFSCLSRTCIATCEL